jgi:hypothetical protein
MLLTASSPSCYFEGLETSLGNKLRVIPPKRPCPPKRLFFYTKIPQLQEPITSAISIRLI